MSHPPHDDRNYYYNPSYSSGSSSTSRKKKSEPNGNLGSIPKKNRSEPSYDSFEAGRDTSRRVGSSDMHRHHHYDQQHHHRDSRMMEEERYGNYGGDMSRGNQHHQRQGGTSWRNNSNNTSQGNYNNRGRGDDAAGWRSKQGGRRDQQPPPGRGGCGGHENAASRRGGGWDDTDHRRDKSTKTQETPLTLEALEKLPFKDRVMYQLSEARVEGFPEGAVVQDTREYMNSKQAAKVSAFHECEKSIKKIYKNSNDDEDDAAQSDTSSEYDPAYPSEKDRAITMVGQVLHALPHNYVFDLGFWGNQSSDLVARCWCPASKHMKVWKSQHEGLSECTCSTEKGRIAPEALVDHVRKKGNLSDFRAVQGSTVDFYEALVHHAIALYIEFLYCNFHGPGIGHRALYPVSSARHTRAVQLENAKQQRMVAENRRKLQKLQERNLYLEKLKTADPDRSDEVEKVQGMMRRLQIDQKEEEEVDEKELAKWRGQLSMTIECIKLGAPTIEIDENGIPIKPNVVVASPQPFSLQYLLDKMYADCSRAKKKDTKRFPFFANDDVTMLLQPWAVKMEDFDYDRYKKKQDKDTALDAGGPTRQFFSKFWSQVRDLYVSIEPKTMVKMEEVFPASGEPVKTEAMSESKSKVYLFVRDDKSEFLAETDERLRSKINVATSSPDKRHFLHQKAEAYYRAVGIVMFRAILCNIQISSAVLPRLMRNILFRGIQPMDKEEYNEADLVSHAVIVGLVDKECNALREIVQDLAVDRRCNSTAALLKGLTLDGRCKFNQFFRALPLDAVTKLIFSKPSIAKEDIVEVMRVKYSALTDEYPGMKEDQRAVFEWLKTSFLQKMAEQNLLSEFLSFCTGHSSVPYREANPNFSIEIEFTLDMDVAHVVRAHSCTNQLLLPAMLSLEHIAEFETKLREYVITLHDRYTMA